MQNSVCSLKEEGECIRCVIYNQLEERTGRSSSSKSKTSKATKKLMTHSVNGELIEEALDDDEKGNNSDTLLLSGVLITIALL